MRKAWLALGLVIAAGCSGSDKGKYKDAPRPAPVVTTAVTHGEFVVRAVFNGDIVAEVADVAAETQGRLVSVTARLGENVARGQVLATIDAGQLKLQLAAAEARLGAAMAELAPAEREFERSRPLVEQGILSSQNIDEMQARVHSVRANAQAAQAEVALLRRRVDDAIVRAPLSGAIAARHHDEGSWVSVGTPLFRIVSSDRIYARLRVPEAQVHALKPGAPVSLETMGVTAGRAAQIIGVASEIDAIDRSAWAEALVLDGRGLQHGMYTRGTVELQRLQDVMIVPVVAVVERVQGSTVGKGVFTAKDGKAVWHPATVLAQDREWAAIAVNLQPGVRVLSGGHIALSDGAPVNIVDDAGASGVTSDTKSASAP